MAQFTDNAGDEWRVEISMGTIKELQTKLNVDVGKLLSDGFKQLADLLADPIRYFSVLSIVLAEQAEQRGLTEEQFARRFTGSVFSESQHAFIEGLADFYPSQQRKAILALLAKSRRMTELMIEMETDKLDNLTDNDLRELYSSMESNLLES